jgi:xanthine dehydrogenase YagS FAD-binding subunit
MQPFHFARAAEAKTAILIHGSSPKDASSNPANATAQYLAGGTTLLDLMKLGVVRPEQVIDINDLEHTKAGAIEIGTDNLRLGAMSDAVLRRSLFEPG